MKVICFGDSNTYGYDPRSRFGERYGLESRWVDILAAKTGWNIINEGQNGREIPPGDILIPEDTDLLIILLGTNDLLQGNSPTMVAGRMKTFLNSLSLERSRLLLVAPLPMQQGEWVPNQSLIRASEQLVRSYQTLSVDLNIQFVDTSSWDIPIAFDGVHFTEEGHKIFAEKLFQELIK